MKLTNSLKLKKPDGSDFYDVENFNYNADVIDEELEKVNSQIGQRVNKAGDEMTGNLKVPTINDIDIVTQRTKRIENLGQKASHRKSAIALCVADNNLGTSFNSFTDGTLTLKRANGLMGVVSLSVQFEKWYGMSKAWYSLTAKGTPPLLLKPCTFVYNGIKYAGIEFQIAVAEYSIITFNGETNFEIFSIDFYDTQNNIALNSEINNSINYTDLTNREHFSFNGKNIAFQQTATETVITTGFAAGWSGEIRVSKTQENQLLLNLMDLLSTTDFPKTLTAVLTLPSELRPTKPHREYLIGLTSTGTEMDGTLCEIVYNISGVIQVRSIIGANTGLRRIANAQSAIQ